MARFTIGSFDTLTIPDNGTRQTSLELYGVSDAQVNSVSVTLDGLRHGILDDLDMLLIGPEGRNLVFLSDAGGSYGYSGDLLRFTDTSSSVPSDEYALVPGSGHHPVAYGDIEAPAEFSNAIPHTSFNHASPGSGNNFASAFGGGAADGTWSLYLADDSGQGVTGSLDGWSLALDVAVSIVSVQGDRTGARDDTFIVTSSGAESGTYQLNDMNVVGFEGIGFFAFDGRLGNDTFLGSGIRDSANGGAGRDTIRTRGGADAVQVRAGQDVAGEIYDGGSGSDELHIIANASTSYVVDLRDDTLSSFERVSFGGGMLNGSTAAIRLLASQIGSGIASNAIVSSSHTSGNKNAADRLEITMGAVSAVNLSAMTFENFRNAADGVTILGDGDAETIRGSSIADTVRGAGGVDTIYGNGGHDLLDGGLGADTMEGGLGDDQFQVDQAGDVVREVAGQGNDRVLASSSYTLGAGVSVETLSTTLTSGTTAINLVGNELANTIVGNAGANILNGRGGIDTLRGFGGDDQYYVDHTGDVMIEVGGEGSDRVLASTGYTLGSGVSVELLTTTDTAGTGAINLFGNQLAQTIIGNRGVNILQGGGGADALTPGNDTAADTIRFVAVSDSTSTTRDTITGLDLNGEDRLDFTLIPTGAIGFVGGNLSDASFNADIAAAVNGALGPKGAVLFDPTGGNLNTAGHAYLVVDANNDGNYTAGADYLVQLINTTGTLDLTDFV